jgi:hypothetical protein
MGFAFNFIITVDWDIHENAAGEVGRSALFGFSEDVCPHCFSRAVKYF